MVQPEYLTTAEVAKLLKISASTVQRMAREGRVSALKVGKLWRFPTASPGIFLYKQEQKVRRRDAAAAKETAAPQRSGFREFLKLACDVGFLEPFQRDAIYGRKP